MSHGKAEVGLHAFEFWNERCGFLGTRKHDDANTKPSFLLIKRRWRLVIR